LLSSVISDVFEQNDEGHLADLLSNWAQSNEEYKKQSSQPNQKAKNQTLPLEAKEEKKKKQSQQTLNEEGSHSDRTAQTSSNNADSGGNNLSPLSIVESEADADASEEESSHGHK
jgi:hypothetical protein